jgi:hypothetical protein
LAALVVGTVVSKENSLHAGFMVPIMKGFMIRAPVGRHLAAPLVGEGGAENNIPAEGVHGCNHEPLHDESGGLLDEGKRARRIRSPVLYMRTIQPNQQPPSGHQHVGQLDGITPHLPSLTWWEAHLVFVRHQAPLDIASIGLPRCRHGCDIDLSSLNRAGENEGESVGLNVSPARAPIMKVAARHEAESKMVKQVPCLRERCRQPRSMTIPEVSSGSLRWAR